MGFNLDVPHSALDEPAGERADPSIAADAVVHDRLVYLLHWRL
jgi:hypothetical protein